MNIDFTGYNCPDECKIELETCIHDLICMMDINGSESIQSTEGKIDGNKYQLYTRVLYKSDSMEVRQICVRRDYEITDATILDITRVVAYLPSRTLDRAIYAFNPNVEGAVQDTIKFLKLICYNNCD